MKYCKRCILPDTRPNLTIDRSGICNACLTSEQKPRIDWKHREELFENLVFEAKKRSKTYDCVIPVSGGKDSTWQVIMALKFGLVPLCVTWRTPARNELGQQNLDNLISLGVDHLDLTINPEIERLFTLKSFEKFGSPVIPMHMAIHALPTQVAVEKQIPLIIWGENSAVEYGGNDPRLKGMEINREWLMNYGVTNGTTALDWIDEDLKKENLAPYFWPDERDIISKNIRAIFLGQYFKWDPTETAEVAKRHGFTSSNDSIIGTYNFADIDDAFLMSIHHWLKWYKFGFTRSWDNLSLEIRANRLKRNDAISELCSIGHELPDKAIDSFCSYTGISRQRFFKISEKFRNKHIWENSTGIWKIKNFLINDWEWLNES